MSALGIEDGALRFGFRSGRARALGERLIELASEAGRAELADDLTAELDRWSRRDTYVVIAGDTKRGKSSLVNALLGRPDLSPVQVEVATSAHLVIRQGAPEAARVFRYGEAAPSEVPIAELAEWMTAAGNPDNKRRVRGVEVLIQHPLLASGIVLIDTPGVGGLEAAHTRVTLRALSEADALLFVLDASRPVTGPELRFLESATRRIETVLFVVTKTDLYPDWGAVIAADREALAANVPRGGERPLLAVDSKLEETALRLEVDGDARLAATLRDRSGMDALRQALDRSIGARLDVLRALNLVRLGEPVVAEMAEVARAVVDGPAADSRLQAELAEIRAQQRALEQLRRDQASSLNARFMNLRQDALRRLGDRIRQLEQWGTRRIASGQQERFGDELVTEASASASDALAVLEAGLEQQALELKRTLGLDHIYISEGDVRRRAASLRIELPPSDPSVGAGGAARDAVGGAMQGFFVADLIGTLFGEELGEVVQWAAAGVFGKLRVDERRGAQFAHAARQQIREVQRQLGEGVPPLITQRADAGKRELAARLGTELKRRERAIEEAVARLEEDARRDAGDRERRRAQAQQRLRELERLERGLLELWAGARSERAVDDQPAEFRR
jgi:hypothetical protein